MLGLSTRKPSNRRLAVATTTTTTHTKSHLTRQSLLTTSSSHRNMLNNPTNNNRNVSASSKVVLIIIVLVMVLYIFVAGYTFSFVEWKSSETKLQPERREEAVVEPIVHDISENIISDDDASKQDIDESDRNKEDVVMKTTNVDSNDDPAVINPKIEQKQTFIWNTLQHFADHRKAVESIDPTKLRKKITAYIEPPLQDTIPGTGDRGNTKDDKDFGTPPQFKKRLPIRTHTPDDLRKIEYSSVQTCRDMPGKFPVDRGLQWDENGQVIVWNVGDKPTPPDFPEQEAPFCPVELDPFLPWIHDVFPSQDGKKIVFIAQNKRRCRTGSKFTENVNRLAPQVALMQSISVQKISEQTARELAPMVWHDDSQNSTRYRLAPYEEASPDGMFTRFICRFHATTVQNGEPVSIFLGETLSEFPFNYEYVSYRKGQKALLSPNGKDTRMFWTSNIHFHCPVPENDAYRNAIATGTMILSDGTPTTFMDLIPIRTSVRYEEIYLTEDMIGPKSTWEIEPFDAAKRWGPKNVLPRVEASGRWENIPICSPPEFVDEEKIETAMAEDVFETIKETRKLVPDIFEKPKKPHYLSACLWAASEFKTRGKHKGSQSDTLDRLQEWIEFHLMVGFDHIYVYDNSGAHTNQTTLEPMLANFPGKVTRIDWPSIVCNNNIPAHDSTGERSSQYAAENSCLARYGPFSEWIASFDTDEYFVPMGNYTNLKDVLRDAASKGTNILSFKSSRGRLRFDKSVAILGGNAREKATDATFLEAYNCDSAGSPKPEWADRARKQIYRTDYVLYHYVHYSTVTKGILTTYRDAQHSQIIWTRKYGEQKPSERATDEVNEAVMIHTKNLPPDMTENYKNRCRYDYEKKWQGCWVAFPWPETHVPQAGKAMHDDDGMEYNCWINKKVDNFWVPKLRAALKERKKT